ncbi:alpha/beta hydrolase family protein [Actinomyces urogenitalis]|uniref:alpha/beta hydrolase family protein n=1 Tax=Actinomyces urogenitalis TaxID=103621 RepID=UPI00254A1D7E|nr:acyl-CoA thioester hydrolase/BAAT C-terminal domain-containing protein [Actinomyces urogenitalis]MDK8237646.1 acyl-CoA thioester hydrolase/BAAT C-terminal domain-containing protein [Actinomyces urogenitalis]WOO94547.1 acyl-CoA thioester hydrolase/BAAT C-terminal domain-containing protein [Actinomyces urogenitalis]
MANDLLTAQELRSGWTWIKAFPRRAWHLLLGLWRQERRRLLVMAAGVLVAVIVLAALGTGGAEIWDITTTLALGAVVLAVSRDHRTIGAVIVTCLALSLVGTLAGPRWSPVAVKDSLVPSTTDTRIGGDVETAPVGSYEVATSQVTITQADGEEVPALLRRPVGVDEPTPGVVFLHGAGTHTQAGFAEQAEALASAGATTLVPNKPTENYSLTERDYVSMAADYEQSLVYLRGLDGVDSGRVGVYAESEGGYPGVILAGTDPQVAFLVLASAPVVMIRQQATYAAGSYLKRVGVPDALLDAAARLLGSRELPRGAFDYADFDARPYEEKITAPVLMLYGTGDSSMPLVQGPATIWDSIRKAGNTQLTVRYYDGANHGLKLGTTTDGPLAPGVARDLSRWVTGLPATASAAPAVAGATPVQDFWAQAPGPARWYASGDLMLGTLIAGVALLAAAGAGWVIGQLPRLRGRRGLHLPDPIGRWSGALALSVLAAWVLYLAYIGLVARLALSYSSNPFISYGGWFVAQMVAWVSVILLVKLSGRIWLMRGHVRRGKRNEGRWLTLPAAAVLCAALAGTLVLLVDLAYWGLFPLLS